METDATISHWEGESDDFKQQVVELLQANLHQLDEVKQSIETQGTYSLFPDSSGYKS